jgi:hypothetical protein
MKSFIEEHYNLLENKMDWATGAAWDWILEFAEKELSESPDVQSIFYHGICDIVNCARAHGVRIGAEIATKIFRGVMET